MQTRWLLAGVPLCGVLVAFDVTHAPSAPSPRQSDATTALVARVYPIGNLGVWRHERGSTFLFDPTVLIAHLKRAVPPETWDDQRACIKPFAPNSTLVVKVAGENHRQIEETLAALRKDRSGMMLPMAEMPR